jgi:RNA polymerase sigma-70 factor (ECF subfamily)
MRLTNAQHPDIAESSRSNGVHAPAQDDDATLVQRISDGDAAALSELYTRYRPRALAVAYRVTSNQAVAEEIAQESFLSIWRHAHTYNPLLGPVRPWIFAIVQNAAIDSLRQTKDASRHMPLEEAWMSPSRTDVFVDAYANVQRAQIWECLLRLPREQRAAIERVYYSGESFVEISRETGIPVGTVKSRVRLGMSKLRRMLAAVA